MNLNIDDVLKGQVPFAKLPLFVPGYSQPQGRPRATVTKDGKARMHNPSRSTRYQAELRILGMKIRQKHPEIVWPHDGPIRLTSMFLFLKPKDWYPGKPCYAGTDHDNLIKPVKDALEKVLWVNDSRILRYGSIGKYYADIEGVLYWIELYHTQEKPRKARVVR